jgi:hypothetical protein
MLSNEEIKSAFDKFLRTLIDLFRKHQYEMDQEYQVSSLSHNHFLQIQKYLVAALAIQLKGCRSECIYTLKRQHLKDINGRYFIELGLEKTDNRSSADFPIVSTLHHLLKKFQNSKYHQSIPVSEDDSVDNRVKDLTFFTLDTLFKKPLSSANVLQYWKYAWGQAMDKPVRNAIILVVLSLSLSCIDM